MLIPFCKIGGNIPTTLVGFGMRSSGSEVIKYFMLISAEHELFPSHKY